MSVSNKLLKPNDEGEYRASQSDLVLGLWTPYGIISPLTTGISPDRHILVVYALQPGVDFKDIQKRKIEYVEARGVKVDTMPLEMDYGETND